MVVVKVEAANVPSPRSELLAEAVCDWVLDHGVAALSLRPLARDLGTSTFSLVYWFGSKEGVVAAALERSERRQQQMIGAWAEEAGFVAPGALFRRYWSWSSSAEGRPYLRLFVELSGLAQRSDDLRGYVDRAIAPWRGLLEAMLARAEIERADVAARATLLSASIAGLQLDLATSGDVARTTAAAELLATRLDEFGRLDLDAFNDAWATLTGRY